MLCPYYPCQSDLESKLWCPAFDADSISTMKSSSNCSEIIFFLIRNFWCPTVLWSIHTPMVKLAASKKQSFKRSTFKVHEQYNWSCFVERLLLIYGREMVFLLNPMVLRLISRNNQILLSGIGRTGTSSVFIKIVRSLTHQLRLWNKQ